jgi:hypothetical protein
VDDGERVKDFVERVIVGLGERAVLHLMVLGTVAPAPEQLAECNMRVPAFVEGSKSLLSALTSDLSRDCCLLAG